MEVPETITVITALLHAANGNNTDLVLIELKKLRNLCARGNQYQESIAKHSELNALLSEILFIGDNKIKQTSLRLMALQVLANSIVGNNTSQRLIWSQHGVQIAAQVYNPPLDQSTDILLMIMYNIYKGSTGSITHQAAVQTCVRVWQTIMCEKCDINLEFLHFFFEHFLVNNGRITIQCYSKLQCEERIAFLEYINTYMRNDSPNGKVCSFLLQQLSKEFKMKSDCVLQQNTTQELYPREVHALLQLLAFGTGSDKYANNFTSDHALFINVSSLLRCLVDAVKTLDVGSIPKPMTKLEEVALNSNISNDFELDVSFELKTLLVRCIANLLYNNKVNKQYCLDTQLIPALLECTVMDARNPLIREWSILAMRNACCECQEIQQVIANLSVQGLAKNDIISELNLDMGSLRISTPKA